MTSMKYIDTNMSLKGIVWHFGIMLTFNYWALDEIDTAVMYVKYWQKEQGETARQVLFFWQLTVQAE